MIKDFRVGNLIIRSDIKATKSSLKKRFGKYLNESQINELDSLVNPKKKKKNVSE